MRSSCLSFLLLLGRISNIGLLIFYPTRADQLNFEPEKSFSATKFKPLHSTMYIVNHMSGFKEIKIYVLVIEHG